MAAQRGATVSTNVGRRYGFIRRSYTRRMGPAGRSALRRGTPDQQADRRRRRNARPVVAVELHDPLHQHVHLTPSRPRRRIDRRLPGPHRPGRQFADAPRRRVRPLQRRRNHPPVAGGSRVPIHQMDPVRPGGRFHQHNSARDRRRLRAATRQRERVRLRGTVDDLPRGAIVMHDVEARRGAWRRRPVRRHIGPSPPASAAIAGGFMRLLRCGMRAAYSAVRAEMGTARREPSLPDHVRPSSTDRA